MKRRAPSASAQYDVAALMAEMFTIDEQICLSHKLDARVDDAALGTYGLLNRRRCIDLP